MSCPICKSANGKLIYKDLIWKCNNCGHGVANLDFKNLNIQNIYDNKYFEGEEYDNYLRDEFILKKNFKNRINLMFSDFKKAYKILEIGSAYGFFGSIVQQELKNSTYFGIEINESAAEYSKVNYGLNIIATDVENDKEWVPEGISHVVMWDVIEHLKTPELIFSKLSNELSKGSEVWLTTGDFNSLLSRWRGQKWRLIHPPSHLHYFTKESLSHLAKINGFYIDKINYPSVNRSFKQIFAGLFKLDDKSKIKQSIYNLIPLHFGFSINTFDIMLVKFVKL